MANEKSTFLLEEYKQLHQSLFKTNDSIVTAIKFAITLLAAFSGALVVASVRYTDTEKEKILMAVLVVSLFFFLLCFMGSFFLLNTFRNVRRMFMAINAIRSYYVSVEKIPIKFVVMPMSTSKYIHRRFGGWPAIYMAHIFGTLFLVTCSVTVYLLLSHCKASKVVLVLFLSTTAIFSFLHARYIEKILKKSTETFSLDDNVEITARKESIQKSGS